MKKKQLMLMICVLLLSFSLIACGDKGQKTAEGTTPPMQNEDKAMGDKTTEDKAMADKAPEDKAMSDKSMDDKSMEAQEYTLEELAKFNGKDGMSAYIAVDGVVYDVTNHPAWKDGGHNGFEAGKDLTEAIEKESPHGKVKLEDLPVVGKLAP